MSRVVSFDDGEILDLDTAEGAYRHVARHLRKTGACSRVFSSLNKIYPSEQLTDFTAAVDQLVEHAEPIYSGNNGEPEEYVVPAEEYQEVFDLLVKIKKG